MMNFPTYKLSTEAQRILKKYISSSWIRAGWELAYTLYQYWEGKQDSVVRILKESMHGPKRPLSDEERTILLNEYEPVIEYCLNPYLRSIYSHTPLLGFQEMPHEDVIKLCLSLNHPSVNEGKSVYLPHCVLGSFAVALNGVYCEGFEENQLNWAFTQIRLEAHGLQSNLVHEKSSSYLEKEKTFDYIYLFAPPSFGTKFEEEIFDLVENRLSSGGCMFLVVPDRFTMATSSWMFDFRKTMIEKGYLRTVISLPFDAQGVPAIEYSTTSTILYIEKKKGEALCMVDATRDFISPNDGMATPFLTHLKWQSIVETIESEDAQYCRVLSYSDLVSPYLIKPAYYVMEFPELQEGEKYVELGRILKIQKGSSRYEEEYIKDVPPVAFSHQLEHCYVDRKALPKFNRNTSGLALWGKNWLFMVKDDRPALCFVDGVSEKESWTDEIGFVEYGEGIRISSSMLAFRFKPEAESSVEQEYVLRMLLSDLVAEQVKRFEGGRFLTIDAPVFNLIRIPVPSKEKQKAFIESQKVVDARLFQARHQQELDELRNEVSFQRHTMGQTIGAVGSWWKILNEQVDSNGGTLSKEDTIGISNPVSVAFIFEQISGYLNELAELNKIFSMNIHYQPEDLNISSFIKEFADKNSHPDFRYVYKQDEEMRYKEDCTHEVGIFFPLNEYKVKSIRFPKEALNTIFKNIISNAIKYGFADRKEKDNIVVIEYFSNGTDAIIEISNNGNPLPESITKQNVFELGITSSASKELHGQGAYQVKKLMREFDGDVELVSKPNDMFPVTYRLTFHKCVIESVDLSQLSDEQ